MPSSAFLSGVVSLRCMQSLSIVVMNITQVYTNSFLATLNARKSIGNHEVDGAELNRHSNTSQSRLKAKSISIRVDTIQVLDTEKSVSYQSLESLFRL